MAENFDLIFGQNASQQYAWSDNDYQKGWETIGNIPPTAAQFDALQRRSDTKLKELNDELTPLVNADTADSRQPSTAYSVDDIKYSSQLPTGWFLTCTTAGTTSASELVLPTPIAEGDTVTDGTVTWTIKKMGTGSGGDGVPLGAIIAYSANGELPSGYLLCDGAAVSRTMYPDLFSAIGTTYGAGDGSTTFNLPDYNTAQRFAQGGTVAGVEKQAGLPNIKGYFGVPDYNDGTINPKNLAGAFSHTSRSPYQLGSAASSTDIEQIDFDASRSSSIYGNSDTVQPPALTCRYIIKAFDGQTHDSALIDITQYANELATKANRQLSNLTADGENHFLKNDFTIIYPNGGSEKSPANVTNLSRYVESNPFPGYYVKCVPEILYNNEWGDPRWIFRFDGDSGYSSYGVRTNQLNDDAVVVQTGSRLRGYPSTCQGDPFGDTSGASPTTAPCRIKVWKIGKIPTA